MKDYDEEIKSIVQAFGLPEETNDIVLKSVYEVLKARIGLRLALELSEDQLEKIQPIMESQDMSKVFATIQTVIPDFDHILDEEIKAIKNAVAEEIRS